MKRYLYYIILIGIIIILTVVFSAWVGKLKAELLQANNTNQSFISGDTNSERTYTIKEFQKYKATADSIAKANGISKTKFINKYIHIKEVLHDTFIVALFDTTQTINEQVDTIHYFNKFNDCYSLFGQIYGDSVEVYLDYQNNIHFFSYWKWNETPFIKRLFKWSWDKSYQGVVVSDCTNDTIQIIDNLQIIKK